MPKRRTRSAIPFVRSNSDVPLIRPKQFDRLIDGMWFNQSITPTPTLTPMSTSTPTPTPSYIPPVGVTTISGFNGPMGIVYCPSNDRMYVCNAAGNNVIVVNPYTRTIETTITGFNNPTGITYSPTSDRIYVVNATTNGNMAVINPATNAIVATTASVYFPYDVVYNPFNDKVYAINSSTQIKVFNPYTYALLSTITTNVAGLPLSMCVDSNNGDVYAFSGTNANLSIANTSYASVYVAAGGTQQGGIYCPTNNTVYYSGQGNIIRIFDPVTRTVTGTINVGTTPNGLGYDPLQNRIYVTNPPDATVSIINPVTNTVVLTLGVGSSPRRAGYCPTTNEMYISNTGSATLSVIDCGGATPPTWSPSLTPTTTPSITPSKTPTPTPTPSHT